MVSVYVVVTLLSPPWPTTVGFISCHALPISIMHGPSRWSCILVSQFSAVQGEDTAEETSVYSKTKCKAVSCAGRLVLQKYYFWDTTTVGYGLWRTTEACENWPRVCLSKEPISNQAFTVSDMRSNSSNRSNDVNNNAARLASSKWLHELCITIR